MLGKEIDQLTELSIGLSERRLRSDRARLQDVLISSRFSWKLVRISVPVGAA